MRFVLVSLLLLIAPLALAGHDGTNGAAVANWGSNAATVGDTVNVEFMCSLDGEIGPPYNEGFQVTDPDGVVRYDNRGPPSGESSPCDGNSINVAVAVDKAGTWTATAYSNQHSASDSLAASAAGDALPSACFVAAPDSRTVYLNAECSSDDNGIASYAWNFGDGATGAGELTSHTYASDGSYTVSLTVYDSANQPASTSQTIQVTHDSAVAPSACFVHTLEDAEVLVNASCSTDDDGITSYAWSFGDDATGTGVTATHEYVSGGSFTITLTVTDELGQTDSATATVVVAGTSTTTTATTGAGGGVTSEATAYPALTVSGLLGAGAFVGAARAKPSKRAGWVVIGATLVAVAAVAYFAPASLPGVAA